LKQLFFSSALAIPSKQFDERALMKGTGLYNTDCLR